MRDKVAQARIRVRLRQVRADNFADSEPVGADVTELRVHVGAGYRVYCGRHGKALVILLCGGNEGSQAVDVKRAKEVTGVTWRPVCSSGNRSRPW